MTVYWRVSECTLTWLCVRLQLVQFQHSHEHQAVSLTRTMTALEERLRQAEEEKSMHRSDYMAAKENSAHLDGVREQLQRKQVALHLEKEQVTVVSVTTLGRLHESRPHYVPVFWVVG